MPNQPKKIIVRRCPPPRPGVTPPPGCRPFITPFGGPASGISPAGSGGGQPAPPIPAPAPIPPPPVPSCTTATIFADCFALCAGVISGAAPGPICGWTFIEPFGALGGQFTFTPGMMSMDTFDADDFPIAFKPLPASLASVFGISGQFEFTEYLTVPNATTTYQVIINNFDLSESYAVSFFGDGSIAVQAGDSTTIPFYSGAWTPSPGASHVVHFAVDGAGFPTLFLDGVAVPLTFLGNVPTFFASYPTNMISYGGGAGVAAAGVSPLTRLFVTAGVTAPETEFCCP